MSVYERATRFRTKTYTPTLTALTTNLTLGPSPIQYGDYIQAGLLVTGTGRIYLGGTSGFAAGSGRYVVSLPVAAEGIRQIASVNQGQGSCIGSFHARDATSGALATGTLQLRTTTSVLLLLSATSTAVTEARPWAWGGHDRISFQFTYYTA